MRKSILFILALIWCTVTYPNTCTKPNEMSVQNQVTPSATGKTYYYIFTTTRCNDELQNFTGEYISLAPKAKPVVTWKEGAVWNFKCQQQ